MVGEQEFSPKQDAAKDFDMMFALTVGLYNTSIQSLLTLHCMNEEGA